MKRMFTTGYRIGGAITLILLYALVVFRGLMAVNPASGAEVETPLESFGMVEIRPAIMPAITTARRALVRSLTSAPRAVRQ